VNNAPPLHVIAEMPVVESVLTAWQPTIGRDFEGYRNHVCRMFNFRFALHDSVEEERQRLTIAGCSHDIGIRTGHTFDYLPPSVLAAKEYLELDGLGA
jgi:hypothetical protein